MTQYRLKHDLPNAKAGDIFDVAEGDNGMFRIDNDTGAEAYYFDTNDIVISITGSL